MLVINYFVTLTNFTPEVGGLAVIRKKATALSFTALSAAAMLAVGKMKQKQF